MNVIIVGSGGREHALAWAAARSPLVRDVICVPGNAGTSALGRNVAVPLVPPFTELIELTRREKVGLVIVGPEAPLVEGLADALRVAGVPVFGPGAAAARLEGSKQFAKNIMHRAGVPTAASTVVANMGEALAELKKRSAFPVVLKVDGLAAGKGVSIHLDADSARHRLEEIFVKQQFGAAGARVLIEDYLDGQEASVLAVSDGRNIVTLPPAQDHKAVGEGDTGPNTGGMGSYCPAPLVTPTMQRDVEQRILRPVIDLMRADGTPFVGCLYAGLMITKDRGPMVLEFNCRFGDPETQSILPLLDCDLVEVMLAAVEGRVNEAALRWKTAADLGGAGADPACALCVVMASEGYPGPYPKGRVIEGLEEAGAMENVIVFHAGTALNDGRIVTGGGRVLGVTGLGPTLQAARDRAYDAVSRIRFEGAFYRRDIGHRAGIRWR
ncbi:MAG: phosphoribosylamine--glycine ligase [Candidatus Sumerlaeia bacterium]